MRSFLPAILAMGFCLAATQTSAANEQALWNALEKGDAFGMMRHALAPGTGDPPQFRLGDCSTQRNLSDKGRDQARRTGDRFRANGIATARILSSGWCRCQETARLLGLGNVETLPSLNSFFEAMERRAAQTRGLSTWLQANKPAGPVVLVTHQVNISALTGRYTSSGEMVVMRWSADGKFEVLGSL